MYFSLSLRVSQKRSEHNLPFVNKGHWFRSFFTLSPFVRVVWQGGAQSTRCRLPISVGLVLVLTNLVQKSRQYRIRFRSSVAAVSLSVVLGPIPVDLVGLSGEQDFTDLTKTKENKTLNWQKLLNDFDHLWQVSYICLGCLRSRGTEAWMMMYNAMLALSSVRFLTS